MESFFKGSNTAKGNEILFFQKAEVEKFKNGNTSFASGGSLSLLYFSDYSRYVLQVNDWRYPLLRRLPIIGEKDAMGGRSYLLPTLNNFFFRLRVEGADASLSNLETIFLNNCNFSVKGQEHIFEKLEASPDDKLFRGAKKESINFMVTASETLKHVTERAKTAIGTLKTGTKNIDSRKRMVNLKDIKNKNFKKEARSTFRKDFFSVHERMSIEFLKMRRENTNLSTMKDFKELSKSTGPSFYIPKEDIEEVILNNKELANRGYINTNATITEQKTTGLIDSVKEGFNNLKEGFTTSSRDRRAVPKFEEVTGSENMVHFQG